MQEKNESLEKKVFELSQNFQNLSEERNRLRTELDKYVVVTIDGEDTAGQSGMDSIMWSESVAVGDIARNNDSFNILHDDRQKIMQLRLELTVLQKEKDDLTDELRKARLSNQSIGTIPAFLDQPPTSLLPPLKVREEMEKMKDENRKLREQLDNVKPKNITTKLENKMKDDCEESEIDWKIKYNTEVPVLLSQIRQLRELLQDSADRMAQQEKIIAENTTLQQQLQVSIFYRNVLISLL